MQLHRNPSFNYKVNILRYFQIDFFYIFHRLSVNCPYDEGIGIKI